MPHLVDLEEGHTLISTRVLLDHIPWFADYPVKLVSWYEGLHYATLILQP